MSVTRELHAKVLRRDGRCFVAGISDTHVCRDKWGEPHDSRDLSKMTVDHVHMHAGGTRGQRAPDDEMHLVTMCAKANIDGPSRAIREAEREYLRSLYGDGCNAT